MTLRGKRVLITGGAGFIGSAIVDQLILEDCEKIVVVDNFLRGRPDNVRNAMRHRCFSLIEGDICDSTLMDKLVAESQVVFHMAALRITHCAAEPQLAKQVMVDAVFDLLQKCVIHGIHKIVAASSASIYGMAKKFPTPESHSPYDNRTLYGATKVFNEALLRSFNEMFGLRYVAMRFFNAYGPRMDMHGKYTEVLIRWMECLDVDESPVILGDGLQTMDFVHVSDVARASIMAAKADVHDEVLNIGSQTETSLRDLAALLARIMEREDVRSFFQKDREVNRVPRRLADISKARRLLGWTPAISLEEGLRELVQWWRQERIRRAPSPIHGIKARISGR
jgi:UDP-glucose 4-epimerase